MHRIHFTVDGEELETQEHELTPVQIMQLAGIDPNNNFLEEVRGQGHNRISFKDAPNEPIKLHNNQKFESTPIGPTTVS